MTRNVALCYVRLSMTKDENDLDSPERQRANILAECEKHGWTPEWHEDAEGHKSGTSEKNRPGWLALKARLNDPDVAAVVANDLARLHRKGWRVGSLLDFLEEHGVGLALAAPGRQLDFSGPQGRILALLIAMMDEWYAVDGSVRQKDSARHRKAQGIIVGGVPFGTVRSKESGRKGILERSPLGVWLLPDGTVVEGHRDEPPSDGAAFRGYIDGVERMYQLFKTGRYGRRKLAEKLHSEGYHFRNRQGEPCRFSEADIRVITGNWPEYGGVVLGGKARDRNFNEIRPDTVKLNPERAVLDIDLCYSVGKVRAERHREKKQPKPGNTRFTAHIFPLSRITFCAHCGAEGTPTYLTGYNGAQGPRYRHAEREHRCGARNRTIKAETLETEFARLIRALTVKPDAVPKLAKLFSDATQKTATEEKRAEALAEIALCKKRIDNAKKLFLMAQIEEDELRRHIEDNERQIARLQAELAEESQIREVIGMAVTILADAERNWDDASNESRQGFAQMLFSEILFDLDTRRIVGFKLKPWVEPYLQAHVGTVMAPEGYGTISRPCTAVPAVRLACAFDSAA